MNLVLQEVNILDMNKKRVAIIGAGIIGVTTAYELAQKGFDVTVFDKNQTCSEESSFANGGVISPGYITPWASPSIFKRLLKEQFSKHASILLRAPHFETLRWLSQSIKASKSERYWRHRQVLQKLALMTQTRLKELTQSLGLDLEQSQGFNIIYRSERHFEWAKSALPYLSDLGVAFQIMDQEALLTKEPALESQTPMVGAIHLPDDQVINCRQFALSLRDEAEKIGVHFEFKSVIDALSPDNPLRLVVNGKPQFFDHVVVCAGMGSLPLLKPLALNLPMTAVYGYSMTAIIKEPLDAPKCGIMDEKYKVTIVRQGNRVRIGGIMEFGGDPKTHNPKAIKTLYKVLEDWFPKATDMGQQIQVWKGARAMLPKGSPIIGATPHSGLWLNLGHGSSGWATSCGSAQVLAGLMSHEISSSEWSELALT